MSEIVILVVIGILSGFMGATMAMAVVKYLLGRGSEPHE